MDDIYSRLSLPQNASKEELKAAFMEWKKIRQQILRTGTREEQSKASSEISEMTTLYKKALNVADSTNIQKKTPKSTVSYEINSSREKTIPAKTISTTDILSESDTLLAAKSERSRTNPKNFLIVALCVAIVILGGIVFYFYDKNSSRADSTVVVQNRMQHTNKPVDNPPPAQETRNNPSIEDKNVGKTSAQREAIQTFLDFHQKITDKALHQAYDCMSDNLQGQISYEGWTPGFKNTVSSLPSNIKIISESESSITLTYDLTAVDNPGGTQTFAGTVTMIKTSSGWKIDDILNRVK